jgi:signal transduction histidine kinase
VFAHGYSTSERGTGLELTIVERSVEADGREITVAESGAGGARFEVTGVDRP